MKNEEINMDKIFREKLEGLQVDPPPGIWDGIQQQLLRQRMNRRLVFYKWAAVAAMVAVAFFGGWYFIGNNDKKVPVIAEKEAVINQEEINIAGDDDRRGIVDKDLLVNNETESVQDVIPVTPVILAGLTEDSELTGTVEEVIESELVSSPEIKSPSLIRSLKAVSVLSGEEEVLAGNMKSTNTGFSETEKRLIAENIMHSRDHVRKEGTWKMGMNVSPGYSSYSASHERDYANNMTYSATDGNGNISTGISVRYKTQGKWSVESGVYYVQNGQKSESMPQFFASSALTDSNTPPVKEGLYFNTDINLEENSMVMNSVAGIVEFENFPQGAEIEASMERTGSYSNAVITSGEFSQVFDFIEIPLFLRYLLVDSRVDLEVAGGLNAGLVVGNKAFINNDYGLQKIGKTRDISTVNLSASIGLGVTYSLNKHISLAIEPRMNYYMNSINKNPDVNFRPYRIGLYSGLYYEF
jgi:hypothetical protein